MGGVPSGDHQPYVYGSSLADLLRSRLAGASDVRIGDSTIQAQLLRRVYEGRNYAPIWTGGPAADVNAKLALTALANADSDGLRTQDYRYDRLSATSALHDEGATAFELLLTDAVLRYASDLRSGHARWVEVEEDAGLPSLGFDFGGALANAIANGTLDAFLANLAPKHREYTRLKRALSRYRAIKAAGGWPTLSLETALAGENAERLRARLVIEDDAAGMGGLAEALVRYQVRNGLAPDGVVGSQTLAALNVSVETRIEQIKANMERWRWMPREFEPRHIAVNVPSATLQYVNHGVTELSSNVVVGSLRKRTPIIRAEATAVTVNPFWYIPASIVWNEIWPRMRGNPYYLQRQGYVLARGQLYQPPGPRNALGRIKIEMPNNFGVYLHDTPAKALFQRDLRALSHGCVRVEQIAPLASLAISGDAMASIDELSSIIASRKTTRINLNERIPVYLFYWTAIADDDGHAGFPRDVYGRDPRLRAALAGARVTQREARVELSP